MSALNVWLSASRPVLFERLHAFDFCGMNFWSSYFNDILSDRLRLKSRFETRENVWSPF